MAISNPASWFISECREKAFTYEGGSKLYHFSCKNLPGFEHHMFLNVVFFANNKKHAAEVLEKMLRAHLGNNHRSTHEEVKAITNSRMKYMKAILDSKQLWEFSLAPCNQFFKVGWASNDTFV